MVNSFVRAVYYTMLDVTPISTSEWGIKQILNRVIYMHYLVEGRSDERTIKQLLMDYLASLNNNQWKKILK